MGSILFEKWVREVDRRFTKEGGKIALLVDNYPAHPSIDNLVSTELIFLPSNTTSKFQLTTKLKSSLGNCNGRVRITFAANFLYFLYFHPRSELISG